MDSQGPGSMPNRHRILIVDDDPGLRDGLTEQLSLHEEFEAVTVEYGIKGVQAAKAGQIDLVIMDVGLPDIDGREAVSFDTSRARWWRAVGGRAELPAWRRMIKSLNGGG